MNLEWKWIWTLATVPGKPNWMEYDLAPGTLKHIVSCTLWICILIAICHKCYLRDFETPYFGKIGVIITPTPHVIWITLENKWDNALKIVLYWTNVCYLNLFHVLLIVFIFLVLGCQKKNPTIPSLVMVGNTYYIDP